MGNRGANLECQDVRSNPVEEVTVVRNDYGASSKLEDRILEGAKRVDVEVVGRLVEEEEVALLLEGARKLQTVTLAPRKVPNLQNPWF
jgi:hypothetical protein